MSLRIDDALKFGIKRLTEHQSESPRIDALVLLSHVLDKPSSYLYTWPEKCLTIQEENAFNVLLERRQVGEPVAYIIGYRDFWSLRLAVGPSTLIPRCDTELLVELALARLPADALTLLDLGTGTGAIALAMAKERPKLEVIGVDFRSEVVELAIKNQLANQISNVSFIQSDWFENIPLQRFSMIVSNPPYIDETDPHLFQGDVRFEPQSALVAKEKGLADIRHICCLGREFLVDSGYLLIEHGYDQGEAVRNIFQMFGYDEIETKSDYAGKDRVTLGIRNAIS